MSDPNDVSPVATHSEIGVRKGDVHVRRSGYTVVSWPSEPRQCTRKRSDSGPKQVSDLNDFLPVATRSETGVS